MDRAGVTNGSEHVNPLESHYARSLDVRMPLRRVPPPPERVALPLFAVLPGETGRECLSPIPSGHSRRSLYDRVDWRAPLLARPPERGFKRGDREVSHFFREAWLSPEALPASRPSTLMSSSIASQWIPRPVPIKRQFFRSLTVA